MLRIAIKRFNTNGMRHKIIFLVFLIILGFILAGCRSTSVPVVSNSKPTIEMPVVVSPAVLILPQQENHALYNRLAEPTLVHLFYEKREFQPLWFSAIGSSVFADSMLTIIQQARYKGLLAQDFHLTELKSLQDSLESVRAIVRMEILFTDAFFVMAHQLKYGRISNYRPSDSLRIALLQQLERGHSPLPLLESQEPTAYQYGKLKEAMMLVLNKATDSARAELLKGGKLDSLADFTLVSSIEINFERWRAMQVPLGERYLWVNIPAYTLYLIEEDTITFQSKVVVGKPESPTPTLSSQVECFVLFPYWYVPRSIAVEEYLPIIQRDRSFLTRNNFDVLNNKGEVLNPDSLDWASFHENYFPVSFRQREGPDNSLGLIKFVFDNPYAVFLHDTNAKGSFKKNMRALSHGCVRIENAFELAHYLLTGNPAKKSRALEKYLAAGEKRTVNVPHPIPIHLTYFTCEFLMGNLYLYPDIYQLDASLIQSFYARAVLP